MATFQERFNTLYEEAKDQNHHLTQGEYAERFGATRNQLNGWLDGRGEPDSEMMKIVAKRSGVNTAWLLGETNIRTPIEKLVDHHTDNSLQDLPPEALERLEEFKEFIRLKYAKKPAKEK